MVYPPVAYGDCARQILVCSKSNGDSTNNLTDGLSQQQRDSCVYLESRNSEFTSISF